jgi:hypothetical protein
MEITTQRTRSIRGKSGLLYVCVVLARVLIGMAILVMLASPFTESVSSLDNFPRGGQDFELTVFVILALLCLLLLAMMCGKGIVHRLLEDRQPLRRDFRECTLGRSSGFALQSSAWSVPKQPPGYGAFALPLLI